MLNKLNLKISIKSPLFLLVHSVLAIYLFSTCGNWRVAAAAYLTFPILMAFTFALSYLILFMILLVIDIRKDLGR